MYGYAESITGAGRNQTRTRSLASSCAESDGVSMSRRALGWGGIGVALGGLDFLSETRKALAAGEVPVEQFLPQADDKGFYFFKPDIRATPALRAGKFDPYSFVLPGSWHQDTVANALSGNYCQPRCGMMRGESPRWGGYIVSSCYQGERTLYSERNR